MELVSTWNEQTWMNFNDPPSEEESQFMMKYFGFSNADNLTDEECKEIIHKCEKRWFYDMQLRYEDIDENDPNNYDEYGSLKAKPMPKHAIMMTSVGCYVFDQLKKRKDNII